MKEVINQTIKKTLLRAVKMAKVGETACKVVGVLYSNPLIQKGLEVIAEGIVETDLSELEAAVADLESLDSPDLTTDEEI